MKQIVVLSGKGGTGKTTIAASLAHLACREAPIGLADADVDASNLELLMAPQRREVRDFFGGATAIIDEESCTTCGTCAEVCRFDAIAAFTGEDGRCHYRVDAVGCEGCAACFYQCPSQAIDMEVQLAGQWFRSDTRFGPLIHARLFAGQENSGKLVAQVKSVARALALQDGHEYLIVDGPPGIGCPVIAACSGADLALIVTEPTIAGVHDLERILATTKHFGLRSVVCINKYDINVVRTRDAERFCASNGVDVIGRIPFDTRVTAAMVVGKTVTEYADGAVSGAIEAIWQELRTVAASSPASSQSIVLEVQPWSPPSEASR